MTIDVFATRAECGRSLSAARGQAEALWKRAMASSQTTCCEPGRFAVQSNATSLPGQTGTKPGANERASAVRETKPRLGPAAGGIPRVRDFRLPAGYIFVPFSGTGKRSSCLSTPGDHQGFEGPQGK